MVGGRKRALRSAGTSSGLGDDGRRERAAVSAPVSPAKTIFYPYTRASLRTRVPNAVGSKRR